MAEVAHPPFHPMPTALTVTHDEFLNGETGKPFGFVQVLVGTPTGVTTFFMEPDEAEKFADNVRFHASQARSGIQVAHSIPTNGHGGIKPVK